jgi:hypothetical protein
MSEGSITGQDVQADMLILQSNQNPICRRNALVLSNSSDGGPMARGSKKKYTSKQKRKAHDIEKGYKKRGVSSKEAERRAWATVNKSDKGGRKKGGGGRGKKRSKSSSRKGGRKGGRR